MVCEATVKVQAGGQRVISTEEGNGPVNALDRALRAALGVAYPRLADFELTDYKVRILQGKHGTDAVTRVLVQTSDDHREWTTVGVDSNVVQASWLAMVDAVRYGLLDADVTPRMAAITGSRYERRAGRTRPSVRVDRTHASQVCGQSVPDAVAGAGGRRRSLATRAGACRAP